MKTIVLLTSGGDAPGMNAAVRAMAKVAASRGVRVLGALDGYEGLIDGRLRELTRSGPLGLSVVPEIDMSLAVGGTVLGSARSSRFRTPEGRKAAAAHLDGVDGLVVVGGDGSLTGAQLLGAETGVPIMGIPGSIDNDIGCTGMALGVDTALNTIVDACDRISDTALSHHRAFVVEVMGRHSGYLAMASAVAAGADAALFREQGRTEEQLVAAVASTVRTCFERDRGKRRVLILKAEGVEIPCTRLVRRVEELLASELPGVEIRATVLGHLVRGGRPSYQDRMMAARLGRVAVDAVLAGETGQMVAWMPPVPGGTPTDDPAVFRFPIARVLEESRALLDGSSPVTQWRVKMLSEAEGVLGV